MAVRVKVSGLAAAKRALTRLTRDVHEAQEEVAEKWADETLRQATAGVPVRSGNLGSALDKRVTGSGEKADAQVGVWEDDAYYGQFVEFGTSKMEAQPFLYPAAANTNRQVPLWTREAINKRVSS
jgi:HK97 gp10 family phage protein